MKQLKQMFLEGGKPTLRIISTFRPFQSLSFYLPSIQSSKTGISWLVKKTILMRIFVKLFSSLLWAIKIFAISNSSDKLYRKRNISNFFWRYCSSAHFPPALQNSMNLMPETRFWSKLKFSVDILKRLR